MNPDMMDTDPGTGADAHAQPGSGAATLHLLPIEVLLRITYWLPTPDLCNIRLTCKALEAMVFNSFAEEFFYRKQFMFSQFSLQALVDISKSKMSRHLRRPQFGTDQILGPGTTTRYSHDIPGAIEAFTRQTEFLSSRLQRDFLAEAFRNLEELEDVVVRDFNSNRRTRDDKEWSSYGKPTITKKYGEITHMRETGSQHHGIDHLATSFAGSVFNSILDALGDARARPKSIEVMLRGRYILHDYSFDLTPALRPAVVDVLNNLEKLHLQVDLVTRQSLTTDDPLRDVKSRCLRLNHNLPWFLTHVPNLKELRINETKSLHDGIVAFATWLSEPASSSPFAPGWPSPVAFERLENLSLGSMVLSKGLLLRTIEKFARTLRSLELWKINLASTGDHRNEFCVPILWHQFLDSLRCVSMPHFRHIMFGCMGESKNLSNLAGPFSNYKTRSISTRDGGVRAEYMGTDWQEFLAIEKDVAVVDQSKRKDVSQLHHDDGQPDDESETGSSDSNSNSDSSSGVSDEEEEEEQEGDGDGDGNGN